MAKGNAFLGTLRGSVGDVTFSRLGGQQITRARNRAPRNPQSVAQQAQRTRFGTIAKFYAHGVSNLFKFAFENKPQIQTDFNAFMNANLNNVPTNSKKGMQEGYPALGNYILSRGSLNTPNLIYDETHKHPQLELTSFRYTQAATQTIGELSQAIMSQYGFEKGTFLTFLRIESPNVPASSLADAIAKGALTEMLAPYIHWDIKQFQLDPDSVALISTLGIFGTTATSAEGVAGVIIPAAGETYDMQVSAGYAIIASKVEADGRVRVSNSTLHNNAAVQAAISVGMTDDWRRWVGENWAIQAKLLAEPQNILEGSISVNSDFQ